MTGISNLNIVVQQSSSAQEAHQARQHSSDHAQIVTARQQVEKEAVERTMVQEPENAEKLRLKKEGRERRRREAEVGEKKKKKKERDRRSTGTGRLLDTVA